jgi:hypothetical protein
MRAKYTFRTQSYINIQVNIGFAYSFEPFSPFKCCQTYQDLFNQEFNFQNIFKEESCEIKNTYLLPIKQDFHVFLHTKPESSKTKFARDSSIEIETRVLTPKSLRSIISSKSCSSLMWPHFNVCVLSLGIITVLVCDSFLTFLLGKLLGRLSLF